MATVVQGARQRSGKQWRAGLNTRARRSWLLAGGSALDARVDTLLEQWSGGPYIFNLGHGVMPDTPVEHIARVVERVTGKPANRMAAE